MFHIKYRYLQFCRRKWTWRLEFKPWRGCLHFTLREFVNEPHFCLFSSSHPASIDSHESFSPYVLIGHLYVTYWPSTEPSIKRCTCVNKRKNSGSRRTLDNNITRCPDGLSQSETGCQREEPACRLRALRPSVTHGWATQAKMRKKCCYGQGRTWVNIVFCPCFQLISHTQQNITLSKLKCERFIFL